LINNQSEISTFESRNFGIDLARTLAISWVILVHTTGIGFGRFGVQLFFVISGYLLGDYFLKQSKLQFLVHRAFRLFPLVIIFIFLFYLKNINNSLEIVLNLSLLQNLFWGSYSFPGGWSISSEWIFSIFLILVIPKHKNKLPFVLMACFILQITSGAYVYLHGGVSSSDLASDYIFKTWLNTTNPFINLGFFVSGIMLLNYRDKLKSINNYLLIMLLLCMILEDQFIGHFMFGWQIAIPALFILCLKTQTRSHVFLRVISYLGKRTYGIFFVHFLIWNNLNVVLNDQQYRFLTQNLSGKFIQFFFVYFLAIIGGSITYKLVEKPFLKISRKLKIS
jgi:peptidoglycan/LPS O-acetylase OafA/YrhL